MSLATEDELASGRARTRLSEWALTGLSIIGGAIALAAPIIANGAPFLLTDSDVYAFTGRTALGAIGHALGGPAPSALSDAAAQHVSVIVGARSAYYGTFVYAVERAGTLWAIVAAQALACAWLIQLATRAVCGVRWPALYAVSIGALTLLTPLPLYVGFVMPDVLSGLAILAAALLCAYPERLSRAEKLAAAVLLAFSLAAHTSHLLTAIALLAGGAAIAAFAGRMRELRARAILPAIALALALIASAFGPGLLKLGAYPAYAPPFLTARLLEAGPGRAALDSICASEDFAICAFRSRPLDKSAQILWAGDREHQVFSASPYAVKQRLAKEDRAFALAVFVREPLQTLWSAGVGAVQQFGAIGVDDVLRADSCQWRVLPPGAFDREALARIGVCADGGSRPPRLPLDVMGVLGMVSAALAMIYLAVELADQRTRAEINGALKMFAAIIVAGVILNAAICGALSGIYPRYQARLIWLAPFLALCWAAQRHHPWLSKVFPRAAR